MYAFLGLINNSQYCFEVDYSLPVRDVYISTAYTFIKDSGTLDILSVCNGAGNCSEDLPSWVPHWDGSANYCDIYGRWPSMPFRTAGSRHHIPQNQKNKCRLLTRGRAVDVVNYKVHAFSESLESATQVISEFLPIDQVFGRITGVSESDETLKGPPLRDSDASTAVANEFFGNGQFQERPVMTRERLLQVILAEGAWGPYAPNDANPQPNIRLDPERIVALLHAYDTASFLDSKANSGWTATEIQGELLACDLSTPKALVGFKEDLKALRTYAYITLDRLLVRGAFGSFGLVSKRVKLGDLVCILHGSKTPVILRSLDDAKNLYEVVCQCYWEDRMYGEAVNWAESEAEEYILV